MYVVISISVSTIHMYVIVNIWHVIERTNNLSQTDRQQKVVD